MTSICFVADRNIYLKRICNYLAKENYSVSLICRNNTGLSEEEFDSRIKIYHLQSTRLIPKIKEVIKIIKIIRPDYVHFQYLVKDLLSALFISGKSKVIVTPWGSDLNIFSKNIFNRIIINIGLLRTKKIQIISNELKSKIIQNFWFIDNTKFYDLSWGVNYEYFHNFSIDDTNNWRKKLALSEENIVLLSYRNHSQLYNHHTLLKSLPGVIEKYPMVKCVFTRGSYNQEYLKNSKKLVSDLHIENHVIFIEEWINDDLMPSLVNLADIVFSIPFHDGLPATLLEIMSTRAIPVISNLYGFDLFFKEGINGFVLKNNDNNEELTKIIIEIIENIQSLKDKFAIANNKYIEQFQNWNIQSEKLKKLYL